MSFGGFERGSTRNQPMAEINVTPLVDVMLVLLVIFMLAAPLLTHALKLELPAEQSPVAGADADTVQLSIDADGALHWQGEVVDEAALRNRFATAARRVPTPEVHVRADRQTRYERVAFVMAAAQQAGLTRIGFVTDPAAAAPALAGANAPATPATPVR